MARKGNLISDVGEYGSILSGIGETVLSESFGYAQRNIERIPRLSEHEEMLLSGFTRKAECGSILNAAGENFTVRVFVQKNPAEENLFHVYEILPGPYCRSGAGIVDGRNCSECFFYKMKEGRIFKVWAKPLEKGY